MLLLHTLAVIDLKLPTDLHIWSVMANRSGMRQMKSAALLATNYSDYICTLMITSKPESMIHEQRWPMIHEQQWQSDQSFVTYIS